MRVLPATDSFETWVVNTTACNRTDSVCISQRGDVFNISRSTSWESKGRFQMDVAANLFDYSNPKYKTNNSLPPKGDYGVASLGLMRSEGGIQLNQQVVAAYDAVNFYLGFFGLASDNTNFPDMYRSFLMTMFNESLIPSLSWGYQVGAAHRGF